MGNIDISCEKAIRFLVDNIPVSDEQSKKPYLPHCIRVGTYLYKEGYSDDIVLAGFLHDVVELSTVTEDVLESEFGGSVAKIVLANSKNKSIEKNKQAEDVIKRCIEYGQDAFIVKTADIMDSYNYYKRVGNQEELEKHCKKNIKLILKYKTNNFNDNIFDILENEYFD